jgi:diguanylate cyclase (GGDEF)-like protein
VAAAVVVVDDEEAVRSTVVALLERAGIGARGFASGADADADDDTHRAAVALIDYRLPDISGLELAVALGDKNPDVRVLLMTGHASMESAIESVGRVDEYLVKPVQPPALIRSVRNALERHALAAENRNLVERLQRLTSYQALYDPLTGLPNRVLLTDHLHEALGQVRGGDTVALLFVDLDGFKLVNDTLGHSTGDQLPSQVGERLNDAVDTGDMVARFGGDKFVVVRARPDAAAGAEAAARRVLERLSQPFGVGGVEHHLSASVGVAVAQPGDGTSPDDLVRNADTAMYRAKAEGRGRCVAYHAGMRDQVLARVDIERGLRQAIETDRLHLAYQPIVELASGRLVGAEALLRWTRPDHGLVLPGDFLAVADEAGLTPALGEWVVERALDDLATFASSRPVPEGFRLWVNAFPHQTADRTLPGRLAAGLTRRGLPAALLGVEIIEEALADLGETIAVLTDLRYMGVAATLDDFGAGHSNLAWLQDLPITALKMDRRFVNELDLAVGGKGALIVQGLIALGKALGLVLLGEGVERPAQAELLRSLGCDWAQGYHFGRPADAAHLWDVA